MKYSNPERGLRIPRSRHARAIALTARPADRRRFVLLAATAVAVAASLVAPHVARAGWPLESAAPVTLGFGATYTDADGTSATHRGVDLAAAQGSAVRSPIAGRVSFVGRVPARGGGTVLAVTIEGEGSSITLLPLASAIAEKGAELADGDAVGELADSGDGSSDGAHLHVGAKRGELYIDPLSLISVPPAPAEETPEPPPAVPSGETQPAGAQAQAPTVLPGAAGVAADVPASGVAVAHGASAPVAGGAGVAVALAAPVPGAAVAPGVSLAGAGPAPAASPMAAAADALAARLGTVSGGSRAGLSLGGLASWVRGVAARGLWAGARLLVAILAAIGTLWPVWRRERGKGEGQILVRPKGDDVAAFADQW